LLIIIKNAVKAAFFMVTYFGDIGDKLSTVRVD